MLTELLYFNNWGIHLFLGYKILFKPNFLGRILMSRKSLLPTQRRGEINQRAQALTSPLTVPQFPFL